jgi:hypothetical protein
MCGNLPKKDNKRGKKEKKEKGGKICGLLPVAFCSFSVSVHQ